MEKQERSVSVAQRTSSGDYSSTTNMVPTVGGAVHYVKKQIGFGGQGVVKEETTITAKDDEAGANVDCQRSGTRFSFKRNKSTRSTRSRSEGNLALQGITGDGQQGLCHALPPRGELRYVYLDMSWTRFGFSLQSYGRRSEEKQTIVQSVTAGSPAFMAGLHPGDCILEVNGQDMTSVSTNDILSAILNTNEKRVQLLVKFTDGAHRLDLKKKLQLAQESLKEKQKSLKQLLATKHCLTSYSSPVNAWVDDCAAIEFLFNESELSTQHLPGDNHHTVPSSYHNLAVYTGDVQYITCDALVMPFDAVNPTVSSPVINFLHKGGDKMMNEISLADQCHLGDAMTTTSGELKSIRGQVYHCLFGQFEDHLRLCFQSSLNKCLARGLVVVAFWLDGFIYCHVPPTLLVETIKKTLCDSSDDFLSKFEVIIFASQILPQLAELVTHIFKHETT